MKHRNAQDTLQLVLNKAQEEQRATGKKVVSMQVFIDAEKQQEQSLRDYQQDYLQKIRDQKNVSVSEIHRYRGFCYQLEQALLQQQEKIHFAEQHVEELQQVLIKQQHKMNVLEELIKKHQLATQQKDDKLLQKISDELASRRFIIQS
jgi:flagellar FliJ protein